MLKQREVSRKKSEKLLFWNKNKIKTCSNTLGNSLPMMLEIKEVSRKNSDKLLFWDKNKTKTCSTHQSIGN